MIKYQRIMMEKIYDIAIVGGGPGGIASAVEAVILGMKDIILLEKSDNHSSTIRRFYKDHKRVDKVYKGQHVELEGHIHFTDGTKESTLDLFDAILHKEHINAHFNTEVESVLNDGSKFIIRSTKGDFYAHYAVISIGKMGQPNKPSYHLPLSLRPRIAFNTQDCTSGEKLLVVGGGDSAVEYACALAEDNRVTLNYRKAIFTRINSANQEHLDECIAKDMLKLRLGVDITELSDDSSRPRAHFSDGLAETFDRIIYAIGGIAPIDFLRKCHVELDESGVPIVDSNQQSSVNGLYIAGDIMFRHGGSIVTALNHGFEISRTIHKLLQHK